MANKEVEVEDNGIGLNQAKNKKSLGTAKSGLIIQLRLELKHFILHHSSLIEI